ncbi:2-succinyl-6-hydroxy-2,4-cyclohexadiene-1-carboxylate synthase [Vibrio kasasachensis]|uniref:2-succinyl-6-hydroxy-2, 4-cyclohexadiene-1-carboxylate synthase n=1 Tax=Vibrio kasasachensis TaxID=2910248 RepID=UPI003D1212CA
MLAYSYHRSTNQTEDMPTLVFLHGLLGCGDDWQACTKHLKSYSILTLDLPGHGRSQDIVCEDFDQVCQQIIDTLNFVLSPNQTVIIIGYSLGARIAMYGIAKHHFDGLNLIKVIIEGGNFGLQDEASRAERWKNDCHWANRFSIEPIGQVLDDWYQQSVFSSLNYEQRQTLITKRSANLGGSIGRMLLATSLAKQPSLLPELSSSGIDIHYICGEKDSKFCQMAEQSHLSFSQIAQAGHNVHFEHPKAFAIDILNQIKARIGE